jgi:hypothetical protein
MFRTAGDKGPGQRAYVGLPSAPAPEPSRRAQVISIPAAANTSAMTNAKWAQRRQNPKDAAAAEASHFFFFRWRAVVATLSCASSEVLHLICLLVHWYMCGLVFRPQIPEALVLHMRQVISEAVS